MTDIEPLIDRANRLLDRLEQLLPPVPASTPDDGCTAYRWRSNGLRGKLEAVPQSSSVQPCDLQCIDDQKHTIDVNTRQFLAGLPANNVLLWGPRGTGKSSLIKAIYNCYSDRGLKIIEVGKKHLVDLPDIVDQIRDFTGYFIIFCDDLSFTSNDDSYKALKVILDGSISQTPDNVLIYATSNRRHLMPEKMQDNIESGFENEELHMSEAVEENISLSERFGLWLSFHPFNQEQYLEITRYWLDQFGISELSGTEVRKQALQWALEHGSRSGRCAWQFARHWAGRTQLDKHE